MEKLIKYHMHVQYHKKRLFEKEKTFSSNRKPTHCFFSMIDSFSNTPRSNWNIQMNWENDVECHQVRPG